MSWLVGWLVGSLVRYARCDLSKTTSPNFVKFARFGQHLCHMSLFVTPEFKIRTVMLIINLQSAIYLGSGLRHLYRICQSDIVSVMPEVILARCVTFHKNPDGGLAEIALSECLLFSVFSSFQE